MTERSAALTELADRYGVATGYEDWTGSWREVPESTLVAALGALGVAANTEEDRHAALARREREYWRQILAPTVITRAGTPTPFWVHVTHGRPVGVWLRLEDGSVRTGLAQLRNDRPPFDLDGRLVGEASFELPADLPQGYHRLAVRAGDTEADAALIVTPAALDPGAVIGPGRVWGLATQLYSVCSEKSWGVGDLTDLTDLATWAGAEHGAGFVLVNPLHAAAPVAPVEPSPYLPTSRRYANPLYLRVEAIAEYADVRHRSRLRKARHLAATRAAGAELIDRDASWRFKRSALRQVFRVRRSAGRELAFRAYCRREGTSLDAFATWCALAERYGPDWHGWPEELRRPDSPAVAEFAARRATAVDFHRWLQWNLDDQLAAAQVGARTAGMALGVMHDLAVGVDPAGADAWALQDVLALGVSAGAPPDEFNQLGQDWSQPPWRPDRLVDTEYAAFRALVETVLRHAGGVRVDHVIGLFRLWWIPRGVRPTEGTYVRYDHDAMIGILALEAARAGAVVVGEDLGTVEPWVRDYLHDRGLLGTSILWFEADRDGAGGPLPASRWRQWCLSAVTTHDLPPTAGYLAGAHVRLRDELGLLTRPADEELAHDRAAQGAWIDELRRVGLVPDPDHGPDEEADRGEVPGTDEVVAALHAYLGRTPSRLLALALTDAVGDVRTQNQPGTSDEYPNWRIPLAGPDGTRLLLEDVFADPRAAALSEVMRRDVTPRRD